MSARFPHFALPLRLAGDSLAVVEQDTVDEVATCVEAILRTPLGFRVELPDFGILEQAFIEGGPDLGALEAAVRRYEPRASLVLDEPAGLDPALTRVRALVGAGPEGAP